MKRDTGKTFLFFAPEAGVQPHFVTLCIIASILKQRGYRVAVVQCHALFDRCPVMDCAGVPYDIPKGDLKGLCDSCYSDSTQIIEHYNLDRILLNDFLTPDLQVSYRQALEEMPEDVRQYTYDGINMGKACFSDVILGTKQYNFETPEQWVLGALRKTTASFLLSYLLIDRLLASVDAAGVLCFNDYALMLAGRLAARKKEVPQFTVTWVGHKGVDFQNFVITQKTTREAITDSIDEWQKWRGLPIDERQIKNGVDDVFARQMSSSIHIYSTRKTLEQGDFFSKLKLQLGKKILVAFSSSYDEVHAADALMSTMGHGGLPYEQPFPDQVSWLEALIRHVEGRDDVQLLIRIHPREAPNKRDSRTSEHLHKLRSHLDREYSNCSIIWPESDISSYDLAEIADLALISWSTMGLELARAGTPVLATTRGIMHPGDVFVQWAPTVESYFGMLEELLASCPDLSRTALAYRFYNYFVFHNSINVSDVIPNSDYRGPGLVREPRESATFERVVAGGEKTTEINFDRLAGAQETLSAVYEAEGLKRQLRRLLHFYFTREQGTEDFRLVTLNHVPYTPEIAAQFPGSRFLAISGNRVQYIVGDTVIRRYSPMCRRLALLCCVRMIEEGAAIAPVKEVGAVRRVKAELELTSRDQALEQARRLAAGGDAVAAADLYQLLVERFPQQGIPLLADLHRQVYASLGDADRYTLYVSRFFDFAIRPGDKVLDIGSGHLPFPFATHLADCALTDGNFGRAGIPFKHLDGKPVYECSVEKMPFGDQEFDFINCSHVLEHVSDPERACAELMRVGRRGYIETPTRGKDQWLNTAAVSNHHWWVEVWDNTLIFTEYDPEQLRGFDSDILLDMHCNPQTDRERAFSALLYLKADTVNVMHYWEREIRCVVRRLPGKAPVAVEGAIRTGGSETAPVTPPLVATSAPACKGSDERKPSCLFINTYYENFLKSFYVSTGAGELPYHEQKSALQAECFGDSDFYSEGLKLQGWLADDLIVNAGPLQMAWARENGFDGTGLSIALEQIRRARPDVVYLQDLSLASRGFIEGIRQLTTLIVAQIASPVPDGAYLEGVDIVVSSFPHFVKRFRAAGITSYYQPLAFDPRVLERLPELPRDIGASFVGGISPNHGKGLEMLEAIAGAAPVEFWGYGAHFLAPGSRIAGRHHGEAWGRDMFTLLKQSRITLNRHIDVAEDAANNMRLFEATGCGALLITDYKDNLSELFEIGSEVVAYRTPEECAALISYYSEHPEEASAIARSGQARTLRDHSYARRMEQTAQTLRCHLRNRKEEGRFAVVDAAGISYGHTPIRQSEVSPELALAWKGREIPEKQRGLVRHELQQMYRGRVPVIYQILADTLRPHLLQGCSLLEIGCASGYYYEILEYLLNRRLDYTGVDYSEAMIDMARDYYPPAKFLAADGADLPFPDRAFHTAISSCILLHVPNYREHIAETARVAREFIVATRTPVCRIQPTQYLKKFAYGVETMELIFNEAELLHEFALNGFRLLDGVQYNSSAEADEYQVTYLFRRC